jgi:hypothetical protein
MQYLVNTIKVAVENYNLSEDKKEKSGLKYGIKHLMRQVPHPPQLWSVEAKKFADKNNIPYDLTWHQQPKYDPGRKNLLAEHKVPLEEVFKKLLKDPNNAEQILLNNNTIVWVTKEEDSRLTKLGYRSNRPDPDKAYEEAGIQIVF